MLAVVLASLHLPEFVCLAFGITDWRKLRHRFAGVSSVIKFLQLFSVVVNYSFMPSEAQEYVASSARMNDE